MAIEGLTAPASPESDTGDTKPGRSLLQVLTEFARRHPDASMGALLLVLALLFVSPGLPPSRVAAPMEQLLAFPPWHTYYPDISPRAVGGDLLLQQLPWRHWMQQELWAGRFPLWASSPAGGMPLFASMQPGVLYPLHLLWILMPVGAGLGIIMALKLWLAGLGMWLFLRALGLHPSSSMLTATGFMFSTWFVSWLTWAHTSVYLLLPWLAWALFAWCRHANRAALFWIAALLGCAILGGHPETLFMVGIVAAVWTLFLLEYRDWRRLVAQIMGLALAAAVGALIGAIQVLPFLGVVELSHAWAVRPATAALAHFHLETQLISDWILPRSWGQPAEGVLSQTTSFTEGNGYVGLAAIGGLMLMLIAAAHRQLALRFALPWVGVLLLAWLATYDDTLGTLIRGLPGFNRTNNVRWVAIVGFAALVAGAFGWDWFARRSTVWVSKQRAERWPPGRLGGAASRLLAVGLAIIAVHAAGLPSEPTMQQKGPWFMVNDDYRSYWAIWGAGIALAMAGAAGLWASAWRARWTAPPMLCALLVLDLWRLLFSVNGTSPAGQYFPETSFIRQVRALVPPTERIMVEGNGMPANSGLVYGIRDWRAQDPMITERVHRAAVLLDPSLTKNVWNDYNMVLENVRLPIAPLLGMQYFIFGAGDNPNTPSLSDPTWPVFTRLAYKDGLGLWRAEGVPGFAYLSDNVQVAANEKSVEAWISKLDWSRTRSYPALVEASPQAVASIKHSTGGSPGKTSVLEYSPGYIKVRTDADRTALLVVAESWYPGWRGQIDGKPADVLRANYLSQGVVIPEGTHTIELNYAPGAFKYGILLSALGLLGLFALAAWGLKKRLVRFSYRHE